MTVQAKGQNEKFYRGIVVFLDDTIYCLVRIYHFLDLQDSAVH